MRHPRTLRAGLYVAVALSGFAAIYVLKEWLPHLWGARPPPASPDDDKTSASQQDHSPETDAHQTDALAETDAHQTDALAETDARQTDEVPPDHAFPNPNTDAPSTGILPPLLTHSLSPPAPSRHTLLSVIDIDTVSSPTSPRSFHPPSGDVEDEIASQNTSDTPVDSFLDVLSPPPTHVISRRRSMRSHDLFAASHISFTELGSLVSPPEDI